MKIKLALAGVALVFAFQAAQAKDQLQPAASYDWAGPYVGVDLGSLWSSTDVTDNGVLVESNASTNGIVGGVLAGFNHQDGQMVIGLEGDFGLSDAHGTGVAAILPAVPNEYDLEWTGHARARLGFAPDEGPLLLFVAGGLAVSRFQFTEGESGDKMSKTYVGGSLGAGAEYGFSESLSARLEYVYDNFGMGSGLIAIHDYKAKLQEQSTLRASLNLQF